MKKLTMNPRSYDLKGLGTWMGKEGVISKTFAEMDKGEIVRLCDAVYLFTIPRDCDDYDKNCLGDFVQTKAIFGEGRK